MMAGKRSGVTVKALKRVLKKAGMKTTGKKATLTRRAKKAHLMGGQLTKAIKEVGKMGYSAVGTAEALAQAPIKGVKAIIN